MSLCSEISSKQEIGSKGIGIGGIRCCSRALWIVSPNQLDGTKTCLGQRNRSKLRLNFLVQAKVVQLNPENSRVW